MIGVFIHNLIFLKKYLFYHFYEHIHHASKCKLKKTEKNIFGKKKILKYVQNQFEESFFLIFFLIFKKIGLGCYAK